VIRRRGVDEARRLLAGDGLIQVTVKKAVLYIELMNRLVARYSDAENNPDRGRFDNRAEGLVVVDAVLLREATNHPASLMTGKGAVGVALMLKDPLAHHNIGSRWLWNKAPCPIVDEGPELVGHRSAPVRIGEGVTIV
jgi:hypothetical protein